MSKSKRKPKGYWKKIENVLDEARRVMDEHGFDTLPSQNKLNELGQSSLGVAISKYHGGFHKLRELLGEEQRKREDGTWQDLDYAISEAKKIIQEHNFDTLPCGSKLSELGYSGLAHAINDYHGDFRKFRELLGQEYIRTEHGLWKDLNYSISEARRVIQEHDFDTLPSQGKLAELGYSGLVNAINDYHGGFRKFRKLLGEEQKKKQDGLWKDLNYSISEARRVIQEHDFDTLPGEKKLSELGYSGLVNAIHRYHGGFRKFRELLGEEQKRIESGLWQTLDYTMEQVKKVMEEYGFDTLPSGNKLRELGYSTLLFAITKYHGGYRNFRKLLGEEQKRIENGLWQDLEYTLDQARQVMDKHGFDTLPSENKLRELGYSSLGMAITNHHGGFPYFRRLLDQELGIPSEREKLEKVLSGYVEE